MKKKTTPRRPKVESNLYPTGICCGCNQEMPLMKLFKHRLPNGDCPDERGLFTLPGDAVETEP